MIFPPAKLKRKGRRDTLFPAVKKLEMAFMARNYSTLGGHCG
jgi:hypothetical protein